MLSLNRNQLSEFLTDSAAIRQFEDLFSVTSTNEQDVLTLKSTVIATTAPLTGGGDLSADRTITIPAATAAVDGFLGATDFVIFFGKQDAYTNLTTIGSLANGAGLLRNDGAGAFSYDTSAYLTGTKVDSFNTRTGAVTLSSADVTGALTYTPINKAGDTGIGDIGMTKFGCNGATPQGKATINGASTDLATVVALCNQLRTLLIANGQAV